MAQPVPGFPLQQLSENDAIAALGTLFGPTPAEAMWARAVDAAGLAAPVEGTGDLLRTCEQLTELSEAMRVASRSLRIRLIAYQAWTRSNIP